MRLFLCFICCLFFSKLVMLLFYVLMCVFVDCKCKSLDRLGENINKKTERNITNTTEKLREENILNKKRNTGYPAHVPPRRNIWYIYIYIYIYIFAEVRGLDILYFCFVVLFSKLFCFVNVSFWLCFMFSPSLFKLLHLQSNKHIQTH